MKKILLTHLLMMTALCLCAQTDITKYYLTNYGFDSQFNYTKSQSNTVEKEIKSIPGWTQGFTMDYTITGIYEFGFKGTFNKGSVPAKGYDDEAGGGLVLSTGWSEKMIYTQSITLPAGTYTLKVPTYNGYTATNGTSMLAWIGGTTVNSTVTSYPSKQWTLDEITFTLTRRTTGKIQIGYQAGGSNSDNSANLVIDYVQLLGSNMTADKTGLRTAITNATKRYRNGTAAGAAELKAEIDKAQGLYDNDEADMIDILEEIYTLNEAVVTFNQANDKTSLITNPSFENGTTGWTIENLSVQTNNAFTIKDGNRYLEKWVEQGNTVGNASVKQTLKNLPNGIYEVTVAAQNISESSPTTSQTGAYIYADDQRTRVTTTKDYSVEFTNISGEVEISFVATNAKGNWLSVDNFRLQFRDELDAESTLAVLQGIIEDAENLQTKPMAGETANSLNAAIEAARGITAESTNEEIQTATQTLQAAMAVAETSISNYSSLNSRLASAKNLQTSNMSITASSELNAAIEVADRIITDPSTTTETELTEALQNLNAAYTHAQTAISEYKSIASYLSQTTSMVSSMMSATAESALTTAIAEGQAISTESTDEEVQRAATNLKTAIADARTSINQYKNLNTQITAAEAVYDETKNEADKLKDELDKAKALAGSQESAPDELVAEVDILKNAVLAFRIANGTGTAPSVTETNHYVATGATQALVRATIQSTSGILEQGVCWSTEHEPTIYDERTTKSFDLNGKIFHIKGLTPATVYYLRPYVISKNYLLAYGDEVKIVTHPQGTCTGSWNEGAPDEEANTRCRNAIQETIDYFNEWTGIMGFHLTGNYGADTPTADCSYGGWMRIGPNAGNQAIGTVLHETGHGVGVGTHTRWSDTNVHNWTWLGREANDVLHFLENNYSQEMVFVGDTQHGWGVNASYDWLVNGAHTDTHQELQYIGGMCILHGLFIDGLDPTSGGWWYTDHNGIPGYTYNFDDDKKYYLMCKDANRGLGEGLLYQRAPAAVGWKPCLTGEVVEDDAAWYMEFVPATGYYRFKNADSGKYLTHSTTGSTISLKSTSSPGTTENFQLMPDRTDVSFSIDGKNFNTHGYWFTWTPSSATFKSMSANTLSDATGYGTIAQADFNYANSATTQQWIILSEDELADYQEKAIATGIQSIAVSNKTMDGKKSVVGIYTTGGVQLKETQPGFNIIRYSDGTTQKIFVK